MLRNRSKCGCLEKRSIPMIKKSALVLLCLLASVSASSINVSITGTVIDSDGDPVPSAELVLAGHADITAETDDTGMFVLSGDIPVHTVRQGSTLSNSLNSLINFTGGTGCIRFVTETGAVNGTVSLFTGKGRMVRTFPLGNVSAGAHTIALPDMADGVYLVTVTVDGQTFLGRILKRAVDIYVTPAYTESGKPAGSFAKRMTAPEVVDTIIVRKTGYTPLREPITGYTFENLQLTLVQAGTAYDCPAPNPDLFAIGMDLSFEESKSASARQSTLEEYKSHGINYIRLRTFVNPRAEDGYDKQNGTCDLAHTIEYGRQIKEMCMGFLVDFHYSNNWADPGKQCVPVEWQDVASIEEMADSVYAYTKDAIEQLIAGGARPDMVQIGNETTPGLLIHRCDGEGLPLRNIDGYNPVNGALYFWSSTDNGAPSGGGVSPGGWENLGKLLNAGAEAVLEVDPDILIALHLDKGNDISSSRSFLTGAIDAGVPVNVFGESCYAGYQGSPSDWERTFDALASEFPDVRFIIAEYSGEQRATNDVMYTMPDNRGIGTFNWAPRPSGNFFDIYDKMKEDYADRL